MMQFVLHEIVARLVAAYLFIDGLQVLWRAIAERKLAFAQDGLVERLLNVPDWVTHRDTNPIRYWLLLVGQVFFLMACLVMMIFGWWTPSR
jgi:hypothetical protein